MTISLCSEAVIFVLTGFIPESNTKLHKELFQTVKSKRIASEGKKNLPEPKVLYLDITLLFAIKNYKKKET